jgi:beta propeller repeat protein
MKYGIIFLVLVLSASGLLLQDSMPANDWICYKGSPERMGSSDAPAPDTLYLQWKLETDTDLWASPVVKDKRVYQVALEKLYCIELNSGDVLWVSDVPVYQSTPFLTDDKIIVATNRGISALSIDNGDVMWEYIVSGRFREILPLRDYIVSSPVVSEGKVVVGTMAYSYYAPDPITLGWPDEMHVICLDENTGKEEWHVEARLGVLTSSCVTHEKAFAASREMMCIDLKKGDILWNSGHKYPYDIDNPVKERYVFLNSTPVLYHGILIAGSSTLQWSFAEQHYIQWQKIVFIDQYTGDILWEWAEEGVLACSPAVYEGKVYLYSLDGMVRCLSFLKGEKLWETSISEPVKFDTTGFRLWPSPTVADNKVYIGSIEGVFYCLDADTGEILWNYETEGEIRSAPAVVPGKVLVSSTDGTLYCFGIDPATYKMKAQQYIEDKMYDKAKEFLIMAKEHAKTNEDTEEINHLLDLVEKEMPEYINRQEKLDKAESFMDEADKMLWDNELGMPIILYMKARNTYNDLHNEFGVSFCEMKIDYIEKKMMHYDIIFIPLMGLGIACLLVLKNIYNRIYLFKTRKKTQEQKILSLITRKNMIAAIVLITIGVALTFGYLKVFGEFQITNDPYHQSSPAIYGEIVVFTDDRNGNYDIYGFNLHTKEEFQITTDENDQVSPAIYNDIVVWDDDRNGNSDIYGFNLSTEEEFQITTDKNDQVSPVIYENIVVWDDYRNRNSDIYGYDLLTGQEFQITKDPSGQNTPAIYNNIVVWNDYRNGNWDIYGFNLTTKDEFQITDNPHDQESPAIYNDIVAWEDNRNGNYDIYMCNLATKEEVQITTNPSDQNRIAFYGDVAVCSELRNSSFQIYGYNLSTKREFQITKNNHSQYEPVIYKNIVVWEDHRNHNWDIYGINVTLKSLLAGKIIFIVLIFLVLFFGLLLVLKKRFFDNR